MVPYGRQDITDADIAAVFDVLRSDHLTQGPAVPALEAVVAAQCRELVIDTLHGPLS